MRGSKIQKVKKSTVARRKAQAIPPRRILVVNHDGDLRQLSTEVLTRSGYQAHAAASAAAAWRALQTRRYDLLIADHDLPNMSGVRLLRKLRAARMAMPVIMASASLTGAEIARHPWIQPAATLLMPYTVDEFLGTVQKVLRVTGGAPGQAMRRRLE
jgi:two-component system OmpR family response regulator